MAMPSETFLLALALIAVSLYPEVCQSAAAAISRAAAGRESESTEDTGSSTRDEHLQMKLAIEQLKCNISAELHAIRAEIGAMHAHFPPTTPAGPDTSGLA